MPVRGQIVDYTYATNVDTANPDGTVTGKVGYTTRPAIVLAETSTDVVDLFVFGESWEFANGTPFQVGIRKGPAAPDTRKGSRVDPTAQPGQPGTWS